MKIVLLGDADDAHGFGLAGLETIVCRGPDDVDRALASTLGSPGEETAAVVVSRSVYQMAPTAIDRAQDRAAGWPVVVVLPDERTSP